MSMPAAKTPGEKASDGEREVAAVGAAGDRDPGRIGEARGDEVVGAARTSANAAYRPCTSSACTNSRPKPDEPRMFGANTVIPAAASAWCCGSKVGPLLRLGAAVQGSAPPAPVGFRRAGRASR